VEYGFHRASMSKQRKAAWSVEAKYILEIRPTPDGNRVMLRDGAGAGFVSAITNERTLGDVLGEALIEPSALLNVIKAHPRSVRPDFRADE
jgi:hypothetical protein